MTVPFLLGADQRADRDPFQTDSKLNKCSRRTRMLCLRRNDRITIPILPTIVAKSAALPSLDQRSAAARAAAKAEFFRRRRERPADRRAREIPSRICHADFKNISEPG